MYLIIQKPQIYWVYRLCVVGGGQIKSPEHLCSNMEVTGFPNQVVQPKLGLNFVPRCSIVHLLSLNMNILCRHLYICDSMIYYAVFLIKNLKSNQSCTVPLYILCYFASPERHGLWWFDRRTVTYQCVYINEPGAWKSLPVALICMYQSCDLVGLALR